MNKNKIIVRVLILLSCVFCVNYLAINYKVFHFGKDSGFIFSDLCVVIFSGMYFYVVVKKTFGFFILGTVAGLISFFFVYFIYSISSELILGDNNGWNIPFIFDQIIVIILVIIFSQIVTSFNLFHSKNIKKK